MKNAKIEERVDERREWQTPEELDLKKETVRDLDVSAEQVQGGRGPTVLNPSGG